MSTPLRENVWPSPLHHCALPLLRETDERVIIGEISGEAVEGFNGNRMLFTALVPLEDVESVLRTVGGIGHGVRCSAADDVMSGKNAFPRFWIDGPGGARFESLVHSWREHNKTVLLPNDAFLMRYGLVPRVLKDGNIAWDDLSGPVYDVVQVIPVSTYTAPSEHTTAQVLVRRDYLEDYLSLRECAAVVTFWDERFSQDDKEVATLIGENGAKMEQPGREMWFMRMDLDSANQVTQVWGCALLMRPSGCPISDPPGVELIWPDRAEPIRGTGIDIEFEHFELAYVQDEVLMEYEKRGEFEIQPEEGLVTYEGRWSVGFCRRVSRNFLKLELRKLYEGAPLDVIRHYQKFARAQAVANGDASGNGRRHVGMRAKDLIKSFTRLTARLNELSDAAGLTFEESDIGRLDAKDLAYKGWWTFENLKPLGYVIPMSFTRPDFLARCTELFKLLENLQVAPLRELVVHLGLKKHDVASFGAVKLLGTVSQLATLAEESGLDLISDAVEISGNWDTTRKIPALERLFALNGLRTMDAHNVSSSAEQKRAATLGTFGIDEDAQRSGWGRALDEVYDQTTTSLTELGDLLSRSYG
jgi:hypothetical protein